MSFIGKFLLSRLSKIMAKTKPIILQFIVSGKKIRKKNFETSLYLLRKIIEKKILNERKKSYICSFSSKIIVYKGLMASAQLDQFYLDLRDKDFVVKTESERRQKKNS